jgi:hypothetical protein
MVGILILLAVALGYCIVALLSMLLVGLIDKNMDREGMMIIGWAWFFAMPIFLMMAAGTGINKLVSQILDKIERPASPSETGPQSTMDE